ncbi:hypothetical protein [Aequorivita xiaoshiensis]|uniref:Uncharacterized protein n=1 Tax=Aequorivita xiaoshiensis TaxID=2874476 RepID=A0A9X1U3H8_9FLAO|nr:hypothetical protein [Aequorivita xiaoshiensis]MCG2430769.1 hypothetical protein [Aequorivita xiaoshiensis]
MRILKYFFLLILIISCVEKENKLDYSLSLQSLDIFLYNEDCNLAHPNPLLLSSYSFNIKVLNITMDSIIVSFNNPIAKLINSNNNVYDLELFKKDNNIVIYEKVNNSFIIPPNGYTILHLRDKNSSNFSFIKFEEEIKRKKIFKSKIVFNEIVEDRDTTSVLKVSNHLKINYFIDDSQASKNDTIKFCDYAKHPPVSNNDIN